MEVEIKQERDCQCPDNPSYGFVIKASFVIAAGDGLARVRAKRRRRHLTGIDDAQGVIAERLNHSRRDDDCGAVGAQAFRHRLPHHRIAFDELDQRAAPEVRAIDDQPHLFGVCRKRLELHARHRRADDVERRLLRGHAVAVVRVDDVEFELARLLKQLLQLVGQRDDQMRAVAEAHLRASQLQIEVAPVADVDARAATKIFAANVNARL